MDVQILVNLNIGECVCLGFLEMLNSPLQGFVQMLDSPRVWQGLGQGRRGTPGQIMVLFEVKL